MDVEVYEVDRYFFAVEEEDGEKWVHIDGVLYPMDIEGEYGWRLEQYCWMYVSFKEMFESGVDPLEVFDTYVHELSDNYKTYIEDIKEEEIESLIEHYSDGKRPKKAVLKPDMECGFYELDYLGGME